MPSLAALTRLAAPALASLLLVGGADGSDAGTVTLPIAAFRLDLTIQRPPVRARLLRGTSETAGGEWTDAGSHGNDRDLIGSRILERAVDGAIQGAAESHLLSSYAGAFPPGPRQVLLTVVSDQDDGPGSAGIYVRSSYVGGVATFPAGPGAPTRDELEAATADAFAIPGEGEAFLRALQGSDVPALDGLLLIGAAGVDGGYTRPVLPEPADSEKGSGGGSILHDGSGGTSVWAVAAVSALGAMFLVISCCTGILYCDWKKRRNRRDARRKERAEARGVHVPGSGGGKRAKGPKSSRSGSRVYSNFDSYDDGGVEMHIVVPPAASGETEPAGSPSTRGSRDDSVPPPPPPPSFPSPGSGRTQPSASTGAGSTRALLGHFTGKASALSSRLGSRGSGRPGPVLAVDTSADPDVPFESSPEVSPIRSPSGRNNVDSSYAPSVTEYSVGEDTAMLYPASAAPTAGRGRLPSRDGDASDWDGYSMDGMSEMGGGYGASTVGGTSSGGGTMNHNGVPRRDVTYAGEARDFDSVWDDESRVTSDNPGGDGASLTSPRDGGAVGEADVRAYGDLTQSLNRLVERTAGEEGGSAGTPGGAAGPPDLDSESESGPDARGAFTLELLGQGPSGDTKRISSGTNDDDDSILGGMYPEIAFDDISGIAGAVDASADAASVGSDDAPSFVGAIERSRESLRGARNIFRGGGGAAAAADEGSVGSARSGRSARSAASAASGASGRSSSRTDDKFVSGLAGGDAPDAASVGSARSAGSARSSSSARSGSSASKVTRATADTASSSIQPAGGEKKHRALGLTNSMEEEVDEDPAAMIDNINVMLSECRTILDKDQGNAGEEAENGGE